MGVPARGRDGFGSSGSDDIRFRSRPESFFASYVVDTGEIDAGQSLIIGGELAWVRGRLSLQGEYLQAFVLRDRLDDVTFGGLYVMGSWFLTPDSRNYDESAAAFEAYVPKQPVSWEKRQIGAFELALRWSYLDLTDRDVRGGRASVIMSGLNWYSNRYVRLQCNVGYASASGGPGADDGVVLQTRIDLLI